MTRLARARLAERRRLCPVLGTSEVVLVLKSTRCFFSLFARAETLSLAAAGGRGAAGTRAETAPVAQTPIDVIPLIWCHCLKVGEFITFGGLLNRKRCLDVEQLFTRNSVSRL